MTACSLVLPENPLAQYVELPANLTNRLHLDDKDFRFLSGENLPSLNTTSLLLKTDENRVYPKRKVVPFFRGQLLNFRAEKTFLRGFSKTLGFRGFTLIVVFHTFQLSESAFLLPKENVTELSVWMFGTQSHSQ